MSLTPVGDYLAKRYPPNDGATHWMGAGDDPGCCAGGHPACLYGAAWREALRSFAADLDQMAGETQAGSNVLLPVAAVTFAEAAARARVKMEESP